MTLETLSITKLRGIAQSLGIPDVFSKQPNVLVQEIRLIQKASVPEEQQPVEPPRYDARLMTRPPSKMTTEEELLQLLQEHISRGLLVTFPEPECWAMRFKEREDMGTTRQPMANVLRCANRIMR